MGIIICIQILELLPYILEYGLSLSHSYLFLKILSLNSCLTHHILAFFIDNSIKRLILIIIYVLVHVTCLDNIIRIYNILIIVTYRYKQQVMIHKALVLANRMFNKNIYRFFQTKLTDQFLKQMKPQYKTSPSFELFRNHITNNSDYFKIFQFIEKEPFSQLSYSQLRTQLANLKYKSDNMLLLRAKLSARLAFNYAMYDQKQQAHKLYNEALEILEESMVPQVLQYYSIYRKYGFFLEQIGQKKKAAEVLSESVQIIKQYVANSDDPVTANYNSLQQARACVKLIYLQPEHRQKWLKMANKYWRQCQSGVYDLVEYAQTVYENSLDKNKTNKKTSRLYAEIQMQKISKQSYHKIILKAFEEDKEKF